MTYRTAVRADGTIALGLGAELAGYLPGVAVEVIVTGAGSLIVVVDQTFHGEVPEWLVARYRALPGPRRLGRRGGHEPQATPSGKPIGKSLGTGE